MGQCLTHACLVGKPGSCKPCLIIYLEAAAAAAAKSQPFQAPPSLHSEGGNVCVQPGIGSIQAVHSGAAKERNKSALPSPLAYLTMCSHCASHIGRHYGMYCFSVSCPGLWYLTPPWAPILSLSLCKLELPIGYLVGRG